MKKIFLLIISIILIASCSTPKRLSSSKLLDDQTFLLTEISTDKSYGFTKDNPIRVGGVDKNTGPLNERRFLNALAGPNGEKVNYHRVGSCCPVKSKNALMGGMALLDIYEVSWEGATDTVSIYINMYDYGELKAPIGFTVKEAIFY